MKKIYVYLIGILTLSSCQYQVDNSDILKVGEAINESFIKKDSLILKQVYQYQMDSISADQKKQIAEISDFFDEGMKPIKVDTSSIWFFKILDLFYQKNSKFYRLRAFYHQDTINNNYYIDELSFSDLNQECEDYKNEPYNPKSDIDFKRIIWDIDYYGKTFKSGVVELQNNTDQDITFIKFRVILMHGDSRWKAKFFLNQTVESYKPIYQGDIVRIEIPEMENYYAGFEIKQDKILFDPELLEVKPKPESYSCKKVEELRNIVLTIKNGK